MPTTGGNVAFLLFAGASIGSRSLRDTSGNVHADCKVLHEGRVQQFATQQHRSVKRSARFKSKNTQANPASVRSSARAVRAVKLQLLAVAKNGGADYEAVAAGYGDKIRRYCKFEETLIRPNPKNSKVPEEQKRAEGERFLKAVTPRDRVVILDERGREITSEGLADMIAKAGDDGVENLVFGIGGPYGHPSEVRETAHDVIRLSKMVLNHQIARLMLLEQLYRAWTILRGEPYHH
ncbi:hypothetical protein CYMTET_31755 [Cymbomonas tetramitiformis]|uniref:Uncharacterized protein n=1 Tax=Cymbomonas tetramitiformis TaxID=36881 RepID=A0AAE0FGE0_9CHLO|nr:hypothetical protein CYMTET_31755 [Cymbomonas tetramitiformis]